MKAGKEHRVPLSTRAVEILKVMQKGQINDYVFSSHGKSTSTHISTGVFLGIMKKMKPYEQYTPHGFRSTFRDWAAETTSFANETLELALAHVISNQTEASYRRQDQLAKRVQLMQRWNDFIESTQANGVVMTLSKTGNPRGKN
jgi:integrase